MRKKIKLIVLLFLSFNIFIFAQETGIPVNEEGKITDSLDADHQYVEPPAQIKPYPFGFYFGTSIILCDTEQNANSPASIAFNLGCEYEYKFAKYVAIHPSVDFSFFHYGWLNRRAYITELENRTALVFNFMADIPVLVHFNLKSWSISFGGGLGFLIRFGVLEPGVNANEQLTKGITASQEIKEINKYLWKNGRFLYPSLRFKTEYTFNSGWKVGIMLKTYIPIFNSWDKLEPQIHFIEGTIIQTGVIIHPAKIK